MNPFLIEDICLSILDLSTKIKEIIHLELLSKYHKKIIRNHNWYTYVRIKNDDIMEYIIANYKIKKLCLMGRWEANKYIKELKKCYLLDIDYCSDLRDEHIKELCSCHTLYLNGKTITDKSIRELKNCYCLQLVRTSITDDSVQELYTCHTLHLFGYDNITDKSVIKLKNCYELDFNWCRKITDESAKELSACYKLHLMGTPVTSDCKNELRSKGVYNIY